MRPLSPRPVPLFLLGGIHDDPVDIGALVVEAVEEAADGDGVVGARIQRQLQRRRQDDPLVRVPLEQRLQLLRLPVHHHAADAAELPCAPDTVRRASGLKSGVGGVSDGCSGRENRD